MIDRACLGRCYSYANYEPATAQFRIRAIAENPIVVSTDNDSLCLQDGSYVVKQRDLPSTGGPGPGRPHGHPYSDSRRTIRHHVLEGFVIKAI